MMLYFYIKRPSVIVGPREIQPSVLLATALIKKDESSQALPERRGI